MKRREVLCLGAAMLALLLALSSDVYADEAPSTDMPTEWTVTDIDFSTEDDTELLEEDYEWSAEFNRDYSLEYSDDTLFMSAFSCPMEFIKPEDAKYTAMKSAITRQNISSEQIELVTYLLDKSKYRPKYSGGEKFNYPNSGYYEWFVNDGKYNVFIEGAKGCMAYSNYAAKLVYKKTIRDTKLDMTGEAGAYTARNLKSFLSKNAQAGEHLRLDQNHSVTFIAANDEGFFFTHYLGDSNPYIFLNFASYDSFANACNRLGCKVYLFNTNEGLNSKSKETIGYSIKFNANGGTGHMKTMTVREGETVTLVANKFKRKGYDFSEWNTKKDGSGKVYNNKQYVKNLGEKDGQIIVLYAVWKPIEYKVKFVGNGATSGSMKIMKNRSYGKKFTLRKNKFKRRGYKFDGWNTKKDGSGKAYTNKQKVKNLTYKNKTVTLYAQWKKNNS